MLAKTGVRNRGAFLRIVGTDVGEELISELPMQIIRTEVAQATASSGEPVLRVTFCGEGGDCITVDMTGVQPDSDEKALGRAKAILVQTATFGLAANEYEAESNGNFDEVAVTATNDEKGSVYVFEYRDGNSNWRVPPARMPSLNVARKEAVRGAVDLLADLRSGTGLSGWLIRVRGEDGTLLHTVDVQEAEAARRAGVQTSAIDSWGE